MNIKILSSLTNVTKKRNNILTIGTHNGIFHSDEVVACAILCLMHSNISVQILRSREVGVRIDIWTHLMRGCIIELCTPI